jgi:hypothetical protein
VDNDEVVEKPEDDLRLEITRKVMEVEVLVSTTTILKNWASP